MKKWLVYILKCADGTLYTGVTNDLSARLAKHRAGTGAKYTRGRGPLQLAYEEKKSSEGAARRREYKIKQLSRAEKIILIYAKESKSKTKRVHGRPSSKTHAGASKK